MSVIISSFKVLPSSEFNKKETKVFCLLADRIARVLHSVWLSIVNFLSFVYNRIISSTNETPQRLGPNLLPEIECAVRERTIRIHQVVDRERHEKAMNKVSLDIQRRPVRQKMEKVFEELVAVTDGKSEIKEKKAQVLDELRNKKNQIQTFESNYLDKIENCKREKEEYKMLRDEIETGEISLERVLTMFRKFVPSVADRDAIYEKIGKNPNVIEKVGELLLGNCQTDWMRGVDRVDANPSLLYPYLLSALDGVIREKEETYQKMVNRQAFQDICYSSQESLDPIVLVGGTINFV